MTKRDFYLNQVYPSVDIPLVEKYPHASFMPTESHHALANHRVVMLVALTGTGKTTTIHKLCELSNVSLTESMSVIPSRREIADWIAIPMAQVLLSEPIQSVEDRVQRFHYTRKFAERVSGGMAQAFSWVNISDDFQQLILSEGIRGDNEIRFVLETFRDWHIIELALHPITRLMRLSSRNDQFDKASGINDVSFLPIDMRDEARQRLKPGEITAKAMTIMRAESESYGLFPFTDGDQYANYHCIHVDDLLPMQVAERVFSIIRSLD